MWRGVFAWGVLSLVLQLGCAQSPPDQPSEVLTPDDTQPPGAPDDIVFGGDGGRPDAGSKDAGDEPRQDGPLDAGVPMGHDAGNAALGLRVFRSETFANEGFWTDAAGLPEGLLEARVTPVQALGLGLHVNAEALDPARKAALVAELADAGTTGPLLNAFETTVALLNANAVIGVVAKDTNLDGKVDVGAGDKAGVSCALCHAVTDGSVLQLPGGGSIGTELDGLANQALAGGKLLAAAKRSRALFPLLQLRMVSRGGVSLGRAPSLAGVDFNSTEAEVDAYLSDDTSYPKGLFDLTPDGVGNPTVIPPLLATTRAAPWGHDGALTDLNDFNNLAVTVALDPTVLLTPKGKGFSDLMGGTLGKEIGDFYSAVLTQLAVVGPFPYVRVDRTDLAPGTPAALVGRRVSEKALQDLAAYTDSLVHPTPEAYDGQAAALGRELFRSVRLGCTGCHQVEPTARVATGIIPIATLWPGYQPTVLFTRPAGVPRPGSTVVRPVDFSPVQDSPGTYDDRLVVFDASTRGAERGYALPLLVDLGRKPRLLVDGSVSSLDALLDPSRGAQAPHPLYVADPTERSEVVEFLKSLR